MKLILNETGKEVRKLFSNADEVWIAVALLTNQGFYYAIPKKVKSNFLIGTYLPTEPKALKRIHSFQNGKESTARVFTEGLFHPKLYMARKGKKLKAIIGSSNYTNGGFKTNTEINYFITDDKELRAILIWYRDQFKRGIMLTQEFIKKYEIKYEKRKKRDKKIEDINNEFAEETQNQLQLIMTRRKLLEKKLMAWMKTKEYKDKLSTTRMSIAKYRKYLDYPRFKNIQIGKFVSKYEFGHTHGLNVPDIERQQSKFRSLVKYLSNESIPIQTRFYESKRGMYRVHKVSKAIITKILMTLDPFKYCVWNSVSQNVIEHYGFKFPRTGNIGLKYRNLLDATDMICKRTGLDSKAVLDTFFYRFNRNYL